MADDSFEVYDSAFIRGFRYLIDVSVYAFGHKVYDSLNNEIVSLKIR